MTEVGHGCQPQWRCLLPDPDWLWAHPVCHLATSMRGFCHSDPMSQLYFTWEGSTQRNADWQWHSVQHLELQGVCQELKCPPTFLMHIQGIWKQHCWMIPQIHKANCCYKKYTLQFYPFTANPLKATPPMGNSCSTPWWTPPPPKKKQHKPSTWQPYKVHKTTNGTLQEKSSLHYQTANTE